MAEPVVDKDTIAKSVTADETKLARQGYTWLGSFMSPGPLISLQVDLPARGSRDRDEVLSLTPSYEDKWANAVSMAAAKCASMEYDVEGDVERRRTQMHDILGAVDGMQGWTQFISKHMQDFTCTDNGAFIEIVRASSSVGSKIVGLLHLDSHRCFRTGYPEIPVIYRDRLGQMHPLKAHQVIAIADMPSSRQTFNGKGFCAASRVYRTIYRMAVIEAYVAEKVSGRRPTAVHLVNGINQKQVGELFASMRAEADARQMVSYMGAAVSGVPTDEPISLVTIPFSEFPDGFDLEAERSNARLEYANALGLDIQDLQPGAIGGSLGSSTQSEVLDDKAKGKTLAYWQKSFTEQLNLKVAGASTTMVFVETDYRDDKAQAESEGAQMENIVKAKNAGFIDADAGVKIAVDKGLLPVGTVAPEPLPGMGPDGKPLPVPPQQQGGGSKAPQVIASDEKPKVAAKEAPMAESIKEAHTGAMVAMIPDEHFAMQIASHIEDVTWPTGTKMTYADDMHCTLAYLGQATDISDTERVRMIEAAHQLAQTELPAVRFNGIARFNGSEEDGDAIVVLLSSPTLNEMAAIARRDIGNESEHPFLAHMTLAYIPKDSPTPTVRKWFDSIRFPEIAIAFGDERISFELTADTPLGSIKSHDIATTFATAFKANRTTAVHITPQVDADNAKRVTTELRGYMRTLVAKCKELCPDDSGTMRESIRYQIRNANTENAEAFLFIGNKSRPEVVVRSSLYGHRGFGPKDEDGVLVFEGADGEPVFTTHVNATDANNWLDAAWKATASERRQLTRSIGALVVDKMDVRDVPLVNAEHIDGYNEDKGETVPNTARNRGRGGMSA